MHEIQVLVGQNEVIEIFESKWTTARLFPLTSDMAIMPVTDSLVVEMIGRRLEWPDLEEVTSGEDLVKGLEAILCSLRKSFLPGRVALLMTQYFGGIGTQAAILVNQEDTLNRPILGSNSINAVLAELGVCHDLATGRDEFDTVGLYRWRSNNDILESAGSCPLEPEDQETI